MNIVFLIDNLDSGGAERQCVELAKALRNSGHAVRVLGYCPGDFYLAELEAAGVGYACLLRNGAVGRILAFRGELARRRPDAVIAFMQTPSILAELASWPRKPWKLIVSERSCMPDRVNFRSRLSLALHNLADHVTTNSRRNAERILAINPKLRDKLKVIYNTVDLGRFRPADGHRPGAPLRLICVASHQENKNARGLIRALSLLPEESRPFVKWFGSQHGANGVPYAAYTAAQELTAELALERWIRFYPPSAKIEDEYRAADALVLPSHMEGCPNVVCEAMACGLPILMGAEVSDAAVFVPGERNGLLFDPADPGAIAAAIARFGDAAADRWQLMSRTSRELAEELFPPRKFIDSYSALLK